MKAKFIEGLVVKKKNEQMDRIEEALQRLFLKYRVVFWYDGKKELSQQFQVINLPGVQKLEVVNNEFEVKHVLLSEQPDSKFLLYFPAEQPSLTNNWLLDLELSNYVFQTDQEALYLQELELPMHLKDLVQAHLEFFKSKERRQKLKELITVDDKEDDLRGKMVAVVFGTSEINCQGFVQAHIAAFAAGDETLEKELIRFNLHDFYWLLVGAKYNYTAGQPGIYDFLLEVFNANSPLGKPGKISKESKILLSLWKDKISHQEAFKSISDKIASDLQVESTLQKLDFEKLMEDDLYRLTEKKVITDLIRLLENDAITLEEVTQTVKKRENKYWYNEHQTFYAAVKNAAALLSFVGMRLPDKFESFKEGVLAYTEELYKADYYYRKFIYEYRKAKQNRVLEPLAKKIEKNYSNEWLMPLNNQWQQVIDGLEKWDVINRHAQRQFFNVYVKPLISKGQRLFVIISDGLRFECGVEYAAQIRAENRFDSSVDYMYTGIPSYTQLGMAALLPHHQLEIIEKSGTVCNNGLPATGIIGRTKILDQFSEVKSTAVNAEEFMKLNSSTDGREFVKQFDLIYIYHNRIDKTGDEKTTEDKVFDAVEDEIVFLTDLVKKIANMNGNNMIITSDHGFLYQNNRLEESDFSVAEISGEIWEESRRYAIGSNPTGDKNTVHFNAAQLGLKGNAEVLIPKSINRFRIKGSGSRYVHGGAALQEIVVPVVRVTKKRQDTTSLVDIDIIKSTDKITTNILAVSFLQAQLISNSVLPRTIRAGIFAGDNELISDQFTYLFDAKEGSERQREVKYVFHISGKAKEKYKNQRVRLLLEEPVEGSSKWIHYKEFLYTLNIGISNEFDTW